MMDCKEGRLLRQMKKEDAAMKIHILLCDDDKDFFAAAHRCRYHPAAASGSIGLRNKKCALLCHNGSTVVAVSDYVSGY